MHDPTCGVYCIEPSPACAHTCKECGGGTAYTGRPGSPTSQDIRAAAALLGLDEKDVPVRVLSVGAWRARPIGETAGDLPCEDCGAAAGIPCDMTIEH